MAASRVAAATSQASAYSHLSYATLVHELQLLASKFPHLASAWTTQQRFGLPSAGTCGNEACLVWVLEVTHQPSLARHPERPDVLLSGALHGDERVGPLATLELARWLLQRYDTDPWARRIVHTRRLLLVPAANAIGYHQRSRSELGRDPNRDFPFEQSPTACMTTVAGRSINELFRSHLIQLVVTFHAGMEAVGYVWGDFHHRRDAAARNRSPDDVGIAALARAASGFAGAGTHGRLYPTAPMNSVVYPVAGGMEDWGYAASWEPQHVQPCAPGTLGGYARARTASYANATARAVVLLLETSDAKAPNAAALGAHSSSSSSSGSSWRAVAGSWRAASSSAAAPDDTWPLVEPVPSAGSTAANAAAGFVPRSVRFALAAIDLTRPHVELETAAASINVPRQCVQLQWRVWGAVHADSTRPVWRAPRGGEWQPAASPAQSGPAVWGYGNGLRAQSTPFDARGRFSTCVPLPAAMAAAASANQAPGGAAASPIALLLAVEATVDSEWGAPHPARVSPARARPQSHVVNARTDPTWRHAANGRAVSGRTRWLSSVALEVEVTADGRLVVPPTDGGPVPPMRTRALTSDGALRGGGARQLSRQLSRQTRRRGQ